MKFWNRERKILTSSKALLFIAILLSILFITVYMLGHNDRICYTTSDNSNVTPAVTPSITVSVPTEAPTASIIINETIPAAPTASFICDPSSGSAPLTVTFTNTSAGSIDSFSWDFNGDGVADNTTDNTPTFTYNTPGTYTATLTVANAGGTDSESQMIVVTPWIPAAPTASFTCNPNSGSVPLTVTFVNTSAGSIDSFSWDFNGDGIADNTTDSTPTFTYDTPGTYTATLTVTNAGGSDSESLMIVVNPSIPAAPTASFTYDPNSGGAPLTVTFVNTSAGSIESFSWDFNGDGIADNTTDNTPTFTYDTPGTYTATLTVANAGGTDSESQMIVVDPLIPAAPVASFTCNPISGSAPLTVIFTNSSVGSIDSFVWDFNGDGVPDNTTDSTPTFTYDAPGSYNATLTVTNAGGTDSTSRMITVTPPIPAAPIASFICDPSSGSSPLTVTFVSTSAGSIDSFSWDFNGDGNADNTTDYAPTFTYDTPGTYTATLTVTNAGGSNSTSQIITVHASIPAAPVASFTCDPISGSAPLTVTFVNTSAGSIDSFAWDFNGDGTVDNTTDYAPTFTYDAPGTYIATLTVANAGGTDSESRTIMIE